MKKVNLIVFVLFSVTAYGQNPIKFNNPDAMWNVARTYPHANPQYPNFVETTTSTYGYSVDTLIGTDSWLKLYRSQDSTFILNLKYLGNIKEANGLVDYMDTTHSIHPLYNFNLQPGDSVLYKFEFGNYYLKVGNIDSVFINGAYLKRFHFLEPWFPPSYLNEVWIEEIGSIHGPLFPANPRFFDSEIPDSTYLTCFKLNNSIVWNNPYYSLCYVNIILGTHDLTKSDVKILPNPLSSDAILKTNSSLQDAILTFYNTLGQVMRTLMNISGKEIKIYRDNLPAGIYFLQLTQDNKLISREKIIITN